MREYDDIISELLCIQTSHGITVGVWDEDNEDWEDFVSDPGEELKFVQMLGQGDVGLAGVGVGVFHHGAELVVVLHGREGGGQGVEGEEPFLPEHLAEGVRPVVLVAAGLDAQGIHVFAELVQPVEDGGELRIVHGEGEIRSGIFRAG